MCHRENRDQGSDTAPTRDSYVCAYVRMFLGRTGKRMYSAFSDTQQSGSLACPSPALSAHFPPATTSGMLILLQRDAVTTVVVEVVVVLEWMTHRRTRRKNENENGKAS